MNIIKNIHKISELISADKLIDLEQAANLHLRHSNIEFKVIGIDGENISIRTTQGKHMSGIYADTQTLISRTRELFNRYLPSYTIITHPVPYQPSQTDIVTPEWINKQMLSKITRVQDISNDTGIDKTNISAWINGKREMSQIVKAMFFFYFNSKKDFKTVFTKNEIKDLKKIIGELENTRILGFKKMIRRRLRDEYGFYISEFTKSKEGFTVADFDKLLDNGQITIEN